MHIRCLSPAHCISLLGHNGATEGLTLRYSVGYWLSVYSLTHIDWCWCLLWTLGRHILNNQEPSDGPTSNRSPMKMYTKTSLANVQQMQEEYSSGQILQESLTFQCWSIRVVKMLLTVFLCAWVFSLSLLVTSSALTKQWGWGGGHQQIARLTYI